MWSVYTFFVKHEDQFTSNLYGINYIEQEIYLSIKVSWHVQRCIWLIILCTTIFETFLTLINSWALKNGVLKYCDTEIYCINNYTCMEKW